MRFLIFMLMIVAMPVAAKEFKASSFNPNACSVDVSYEPDAGVNIETGFDFGAEPVRFPVTIDLVEAFDLDIDLGNQAEPNFGEIEVHPDGRTFYRGKDISSKVDEACKNKKEQKNEQENQEEQLEEQENEQETEDSDNANAE